MASGYHRWNRMSGSTPFPVTIDKGSAYTTSSLLTNDLYIHRVDNSPPVLGAGVLATDMAPMVYMRLDTQSGGFTGSHTGLLIYLPDISGRSYTTTTQTITGSGTAQTVNVVDSSVFIVGDTIYIDPLGLIEGVVVISVPSSTSVNGIFLNNHSSGVRIGNWLLGSKIGIGVGMYDDPQNKNNLFPANFNVVNYSIHPHTVTGVEIDVSNYALVSESPNVYVTAGDVYTAATPWLNGLVINSAGAGGSTNGIYLTAGVPGGRFRRGMLICGATDYAIQVGTDLGSAGIYAPYAGLGVYAANTYGVIVGVNQTTPGSDPTGIHAVYDPPVHFMATSRAQSGAANSGNYRMQVSESSSPAGLHNWDIYGASGFGGLIIQYDGNTMFTLSPTGELTVPNFMRVLGSSPALYLHDSDGGGKQFYFNVAGGTLNLVNGSDALTILQYTSGGGLECVPLFTASGGIFTPGIMNAVTYKVDGTSGANFSGAVNNITVVSGIVTSAS